jgi:allantoinase
MKRAAQLGSLVAVHAESETLTRQLTEERLAHDLTTARDYLESRPIEAELEAIRLALELGGETGCPLHIVHVSCGEGVALIAQARDQGVDVTCETCPHYLVFTEEDVLECGGFFKCAPPLRPQTSQEKLWEHLLAADINTIASDHSPAPSELKYGENFFKIWGGITGVQQTLAVMLDKAHLRRGLSLPVLSRLWSLNVAARFKLPVEKGGLKIGGDADLALVDLNGGTAFTTEELLQRHKHSAYAGWQVAPRVDYTLVRGRPVQRDGRIVSPPWGRLVKPQSTG